MALTSLAVLSSASAQSAPRQDRSFSPQLFHAAPGPDEFITVEAAPVLGHKAFAFGAFFNYARDEFALLGYNSTNSQATGARANLIGNAIGADLWAGFGLWNRLQIALALPMTIYQNGQDFNDTNPAPDGTHTKAASGFALGDLRLHLKLRLLGKERGFQLSISHWLGFPTGNHNDFGGEKSVSGEGRVLAGWEGDRFRIGAFIGFLWRAHESEFYSTTVGQQITYGGAGAYDVVRHRFTLILELWGRHDFTSDFQASPLELDLAGKIFVHSGLSLNVGVGTGLVSGLGSPEPRFFLGVVYAPDRRDRDHDGVPDISDKCPDVAEDRDGFQDDDGCPDPDNDNDTIPDVADKCPNQPEDFDQFQDEDGCPDPDNDNDGIDDLHDACPMDPEDHLPPNPNDGCPLSKTDTDGDGVPDSIDKCPKDAEDKDGFQDEDGCPDLDNDNDGIPDSFDQCPNEPEDMDGFQDDDGCPDPDNDKDGIPDKLDKCPNEPENINGFQDEDGCPDKGPPSKVKIENGQIVILEKVYFATAKSTILPKSFNLLDQVAQTIKAHAEFRIRIEGYTDSQGKSDMNTRLSQGRADAVLEYLVQKGIDKARLIAAGYGSANPIADNKTAKGREANRRVEFHIVEQAPPAKPDDAADDADDKAAPDKAATDKAAPAPAPAATKRQ